LNKKLKCLLLDDEIPGLTLLKMLCEEIPQLEVVKAFNDPHRLIDEAPNLDFDLCILDIEMPGSNGLEVAHVLKTKAVIFTTAHKHFASDAFDIDAVDYILKPVRKERLQQAVVKAVARTTHNPLTRPAIYLNSDQGKVTLQFNEVCYITTAEGDSRDKVVVMREGRSIVLKNITFEKLEMQLPTNIFARINKKQIIALDTVRSFTASAIEIKIPAPFGGILHCVLSEKYRPAFLSNMK